jgi:hypothetical protein
VSPITAHQSPRRLTYDLYALTIIGLDFTEKHGFGDCISLTRDTYLGFENLTFIRTRAERFPHSTSKFAAFDLHGFSWCRWREGSNRFSYPGNWRFKACASAE